MQRLVAGDDAPRRRRRGRWGRWSIFLRMMLMVRSDQTIRSDDTSDRVNGAMGRWSRSSQDSRERALEGSAAAREVASFRRRPTRGPGRRPRRGGIACRRDRSASLGCRCWPSAWSSACSSPPAAARRATPSPAASAAAAAAPLDGVWLLTDYVSPMGRRRTCRRGDAEHPFGGNAATGKAGCNTFKRSRPSRATVRFDTVQSRRLSCEDPMAAVEIVFLQALNLSTK